MIDLHVHSTASDGTLTPTEILERASKLGIEALAITDHDTIDGSIEAIESGIPEGLDFLTGIEISANPPEVYPCTGSFHILGYNMDLKSEILNTTLKTLQDARFNRNPKILERLAGFGMHITEEEVEIQTGGGQTGRPHIAEVMIKKGYAKNINDAFDNYLGKGMPAYVDKYRIETDKAIELIKSAGGVPVFAHPGLVEATQGDPKEKLIASMAEMGLSGIEVFYPNHSKEETDFYINLAKKYNLIITGGTDFHGSLKPDTELGSGKGDLCIPYSIYEGIMNVST